ncbi:hypothetical protein [Microvirga massiliensis]|uniref:ribonuclease toxin HepT-like protein n=1 Tax=Microvirga massiliensis TaxID=1033741 RepID=UPI00069AD884|nr:hypothetical protein [Microvirga massiliensis]
MDDFLRRYDSLAPEMVSEWGRTTVVASAVANAYNGIEDVLTNIARDIDGAVPQGESWHQDLLDEMRAELRDTRAALLDERLHGLLTEPKPRLDPYANICISGMEAIEGPCRRYLSRPATVSSSTRTCGQCTRQTAQRLAGGEGRPREALHQGCSGSQCITG